MEITIPTSLKEINCYQWQKLEEAFKTINNEPLLKIVVISNVCEIKINELVKFKMSDINDIYNQINEIVTQKPKVEHFTIDGVKYGFIPNIEAMSGAEFLDAESYFENDIFKFMAVVYRPIKEEVRGSYRLKKYKGADDLAPIMLKAPASAYVAAKVFFSTLLIDLLSVTPASILKNLTSSEVVLLESAGVITSQLTSLLEEIGYDTKKSLMN
jgi:hypothetical protein